MLERFVKDARRIAEGAREAAQRAGSGTVEAEHVLLALAGDRGPAGAVLAAAGLDRAGVEAALGAEFARSLAAVGVAVPDTGEALPLTGSPRWGASAKAALAGALEATRARGDRRIEPPHILLAVLAASEGTVPRALRLAGVDPAELARDAHAALDARRCAA